MVSVECVAFTLRECEFHDFVQKLMFLSGEVSEQASPYQMRVVSLKSQSIIKVLIKVSFECVAFILCEFEIHDFDQ